MSVRISAYCRAKQKGSLHRWDTDINTVTHMGEVERLIYDVSQEAKREHGKNFKPPILLVIEDLKDEVPAPFSPDQPEPTGPLLEA